MVESAKTGRGGFSAELQQSALSVEQCLGILTDPTLLNLCHHPYKSANRPHFLALSKSAPAYSPRFTSPKRRSRRPPLIIHTTPSSPAYSEKPAPFSIRPASSCRPAHTACQPRRSCVSAIPPVEAQAEAYCTSKSACSSCGRRLRKKGRCAIRYRTVFGDIPVTSPRYYRCRCKGRRPQTFSPLTDLLPDHTAPELLWLETRWASLVSFDTATGLLKDVLPIGERLNAETVRNHLHKTARRMEDELADEQFSFIGTCPR